MKGCMDNFVSKYRKEGMVLVEDALSLGLVKELKL
jgi:hypothetical protein